jgi:hypothetical protein
MGSLGPTVYGGGRVVNGINDDGGQEGLSSEKIYILDRLADQRFGRTELRRHVPTGPTLQLPVG